jgi:preprotein translocase subunit SecG
MTCYVAGGGAQDVFKGRGRERVLPREIPLLAIRWVTTYIHYY